MGTIVDTRNLFSRFTCLRSIPHEGEERGAAGGLLLQLLLPGPAAMDSRGTDQWEQMTLLLVD